MKYWFLLILILFISLGARADVIPTDEKQEVQNKQHEDLPDSNPSSPPLETDDPGTPGPYGIEVNLIENLELFSNNKNNAVAIDANFGIGEYLQLRFSKEQLQETQPGTDTFSGYGPSSLAIKWRFLDNNSLKLAVYPSYQLNDATLRPGVDKKGASLYFPLIISKTFGLSTVVLNIGATKNFDNPDERSSFYSVAVGRACSETSRCFGEVASEKTNNNQQIDLRVGFVKELFPNEKSNYETGLFGSVGHSVGWTEDQLDHTKILFGISIAKKPKSETLN